MNNFVLITLGTGLGSGVFTNGNLVYGNRGFAGEMGHMSINPNGRKCNCGKKGCLEMYVSAKGITQTVKNLYITQPENRFLYEILENAKIKDVNGNVSGRDIDKAFDTIDYSLTKIEDEFKQDSTVSE